MHLSIRGTLSCVSIHDIGGTELANSHVGEEGVVMVAVPETTVHIPAPSEGVLPDNEVLVTSHGTVMSEPALAVVGVASTTIVSVWAAGDVPQLLLASKR